MVLDLAAQVNTAKESRVLVSYLLQIKQIYIRSNWKSFPMKKFSANSCLQILYLFLKKIKLYLYIHIYVDSKNYILYLNMCTYFQFRKDEVEVVPSIGGVIQDNFPVIRILFTKSETFFLSLLRKLLNYPLK